MYPEIIIVGKAISSYGIMAVVGALVAISYGYVQIKSKALSKEDYFLMLGYGFIGLIIGAKLFYQIPRLNELWIYSDIIFKNIETLTTYIFSGFVFYGGLIGLVIGILVYAHEFHIDIKPYIVCLLPAIPLFHAFGRVGCFLSGCCYGIPMEEPLGILYHTSYANDPDAVRFPVQLVEAFANVGLFCFLHFYNHKTIKKYSIISIYLLFYSCIRFILEFLRGDLGRGIFLLSTSQWISLLMIGFACYFSIHQERLWLKIRRWNGTSQ